MLGNGFTHTSLCNSSHLGLLDKRLSRLRKCRCRYEISWVSSIDRSLTRHRKNDKLNHGSGLIHRKLFVTNDKDDAALLLWSHNLRLKELESVDQKGRITDATIRNTFRSNGFVLRRDFLPHCDAAALVLRPERKSNLQLYEYWVNQRGTHLNFFFHILLPLIREWN